MDERILAILDKIEVMIENSGKQMEVKRVKEAIKRDFKVILIGCNEIELSTYRDTPNLLIPPIDNSKKAIAILKWLLKEIEGRNNLFNSAGVKDIKEYNKEYSNSKLPEILTIIDNIPDMSIFDKNELMSLIKLLLSKSKNMGTHFIISNLDNEETKEEERIYAN